MAKRRVVVRSRSQGGGRPGTRRSGDGTYQGEEGDPADPYYRAQQAKEEGGGAPGHIVIEIPLDAGTQITTEGPDVVVAHAIGYTVRFKLRDDPFLFKKLMEAVTGLDIAKRIEKQVAAIKAADQRKPAAPDTPPERRRNGRGSLVVGKGAPTAAEARRGLKRR